MEIVHDKFDCYFGVRPTSNILHLGHSMTLFNMFRTILSNFDKVNTIYFLMAEIHAEISILDVNTIRTNTITLKGQILTLFLAYLKANDVDRNDINYLIRKVKFIMQFDHADYHIGLVYKYLPLMKLGTLLKNPIFKEGSNTSTAFLLYPVLQAFDVFLYTKPNIPMIVFVGNDQRANINILRDIAKKLKFKDSNILVQSHLYEHILSDNKSTTKMSKSLNNFVKFNDIVGIKKYINGYITYSRTSATTPGVHNECPFYLKFGMEVERLFPNALTMFNQCDTGCTTCGNCKNAISDIFVQICKTCTVPVDYYDTIVNFDWRLYQIQSYDIIKEHKRILESINNIRSSK